MKILPVIPNLKMESSVKDVLYLIFLSLVFFVLMAFDTNSWYYSAIGDEYTVFNFGKDIVSGKISLSFFPSSQVISVFTQNGAYNHIPVASTIFQALWMKLFGINHRGWIFGSILTVIISFWFFYFLVNDLFERKTAIISSSIFASSHYLWAMIHTGYWNIQILFTHLAALFFFFHAVKKKSSILFFWAGIFSGLGFYTYYSARITIILLTFFLFLNLKNFTFRKGVVLFFIGFLIFFLPFFFINKGDIINSMLTQSLVGSAEIPKNYKLAFFIINILNSLLGFYQNVVTHHFVSGALVDPITIFFFSSCILFMISHFRKFYFLLSWFFLSLIILGGFSPYVTLPITRLFFLLPVISIIAGYAIALFIDFIKSKFSNFLSYLSLGILLLFILFLNVYKFYKVTPSKMDLTAEAVTIGALTSFPQCRIKAVIFFPYYEGVLNSAVASYGLTAVNFLKDKNEINLLDISQQSCIIFSLPEEEPAAQLIQQFSYDRRFIKRSFSSLSKNAHVVIFLRKNYD